MPATQIASDVRPAGDDSLPLARLLAALEGIGLLQAAEVPAELTLAGAMPFLERLGRHGVGRVTLQALAARAQGGRTRAVAPSRLLGRLLEEVEESPLPDIEWEAAARILPSEQLAALTGISDSSLRRYLGGARRTPDDVARRLHHLALILGDLLGAYNDFGIRRWFARPRQALDGRAPGDVLTGEWDPDHAGPQRVRALATSLAASPAT